MEKSYTLALDQQLLELIDRPVRNHEDCIQVLLNAMKFMQVKNRLKIENPIASITFAVSKMSRIFLSKENCIYSISCPFTIEETETGIKFKSPHIGEISSPIISEALVVFNNNIFSDECITELADKVLDIGDLNPGFWSFIKDLLVFESGYLRYDLDTIRENGFLHPLNHLDIFFSSQNTFKIGHDDGVNLDLFNDILNTQTNCHYLIKK